MKSSPSSLDAGGSLISGYFSYDSIRYIEKIPNNCVANIALDWELKGANANYFGEDSSSTAIHDAYLKVRAGRIDQAITVASLTRKDGGDLVILSGQLEIRLVDS